MKRYSKNPVGAHYGTGDWLMQRLTALVTAVYTVAMFAFLAWKPPRSYGELKATFAGGFLRLATVLFVAALAYHAWVGMRDILMDYVKPVGMRLALEVLVGGVLIAYVVWSASILWAGR